VIHTKVICYFSAITCSMKVYISNLSGRDWKIIMTKNIFDKIELSSGKTFENRLVMAPMTTQCSFHYGSVTDELVEYYTGCAGGTEAFMVESKYIDNYGLAFEGAHGEDSDDKIRGLKKLADGIKKKGSKAIMQHYHVGLMGTPELNKGRRPISASS